MLRAVVRGGSGQGGKGWGFGSPAQRGLEWEERRNVKVRSVKSRSSFESINEEGRDEEKARRIQGNIYNSQEEGGGTGKIRLSLPTAEKVSSAALPGGSVSRPRRPSAGSHLMMVKSRSWMAHQDPIQGFRG